MDWLFRGTGSLAADLFGPSRQNRPGPAAARDALRKERAKFGFQTYAGGHGWQGDVCGNIRAGLRWLAENHAQPKKS